MLPAALAILVASLIRPVTELFTAVMVSLIQQTIKKCSDQILVLQTFCAEHNKDSVSKKTMVC